MEREGSFQVMAQAEKALYTLIYHDPHGKNTGTAEQKVRYGSTVLLSPGRARRIRLRRLV